jgi:hypothetical protein
MPSKLKRVMSWHLGEDEGAGYALELGVLACVEREIVARVISDNGHLKTVKVGDSQHRTSN